MRPERRKQAEELFQTAKDLPAGQRAAFLKERCDSDAALRDEVEALVATSEADTMEVLVTPVSAPSAVPGEQPGDRIGPYTLLSHVGQGAFGDVYVAEQTAPVRRTVALNIVKLGMDTRQVVARFEAERQALALMQHRA